ncbi:dTDP-4-amino-4,6-dideoxy-D-glucose transaminase [Andreesenia angusta]|uniref:dTDP-4-amino-4,6-dideoxy-D-glucose transaminase n=1 Tax=Andreesenia angusta TaxID=39480 RepID=A0A1S1V5M8_9FIRM|nr:DegT/DnrJ/EryC1/StrS family aminotransferase [Andreesenia angusta]OHW61872.1 dTDP-4-amino-4,6-dideoxy-D-glucose transaminase [Andreesenia angusta]
MKTENMTKIMMANRSSMPSIEEYIEQIRPLWNSRWLSNEGAILQKFKASLENYLGLGNIELFVNGHTALELAISSMGLSGEVITSPFTFISTPNAIVRNGLTPVFCDISEEDFNIDVQKIESLITEKTTAIVPVHIYGNPCDLEGIERIAQKYNLKVIYDAAQAFGVEVDGKSILEFGDITMVSFHATKCFHSIEGGMLSFKDSRKREQLRKVKSFGIVSEDGTELLGVNAKMNEFQAAMGICNLSHFEGYLEKRKSIHMRYREQLAEVPGIKLAKHRANVKPNYTYMPAQVDKEAYGLDRDELLERLSAEHIFADKYFYPLVVDYEYYRDRYSEIELPTARHVANSMVLLPMHTEMEFKDVDRVCEIIRRSSK